MDDLKPCPFCGCVAEVYSATCRVPEEDGVSDAHWVVDCRNCNGNVELHLSPEEAVAAWNTRSPPPGYALVKLEGVEERVAEIIYALAPIPRDTNIENPVWSYMLWEEISESAKDKYRATAQAAIKAMEGK